MPEPAKADQKYLPGLDGLRALAVAAVIAYHLGYGWAQGGLLGVGVFFTLSGYLITDILVGQWAAHGRIRLADFWLRRARRLLPALFVMLAVVTLWVTAFARTFLPGFRGNVIASVLYVSNWWYIGQHSSYYARFAPPAPLDHLWSLAVEEQFYLVWPWLVLLLVWLAARRYLTSRSRLWLAAATLVLAAVSAVLMAALYQPGYDPTRDYEGTDTRAFGLLIGAAVAIAWPTRGRVAAQGGTGRDGTGRGGTGRGGAGRDAGVRADSGRVVPAGVRRLLDAAGIAGLAVIGLLVWRTNEYSGFMFRGGLVLLSAATAAAVAAAVTPGSLVGRALGVRPLRWLGVRSYGIYLWHYPLIVLTAAAGSAGGPVSPGRAAAVVAGTVAVAAASWRLVEEPIRRGTRLPRVRLSQPRLAQLGLARVGVARIRRARPLHSPPGVFGLCLLIAAVLTASVTVSTRLLSNSTQPAAAAGRRPAQAAGQVPGARAGAVAPPGTSGRSAGRSATAPVGQAAKTGATGRAARDAVAGAVAAAVPARPAAVVPGLPTPPLRTSCTSVVHIGDSTSEGLVSPDYEPKAANRIPARYADVGVRKSVMKIVGATSVVESLPGTPNAYEMARQVKSSGFHGCWVLALGTNDTADVYAGSNVGRIQRIQKMMNVIGNQPVMWVEVSSRLTSGPYSEQNMQLWNQALQQQLPRYPNMRIYDWPAVVRKSWYISDGIHYTSAGYAHRAVAIADALAEAFPAKS